MFSSPRGRTESAEQNSAAVSLMNTIVERNKPQFLHLLANHVNTNYDNGEDTNYNALEIAMNQLCDDLMTGTGGLMLDYVHKLLDNRARPRNRHINVVTNLIGAMIKEDKKEISLELLTLLSKMHSYYAHWKITEIRSLEDEVEMLRVCPEVPEVVKQQSSPRKEVRIQEQLNETFDPTQVIRPRANTSEMISPKDKKHDKSPAKLKGILSSPRNTNEVVAKLLPSPRQETKPRANTNEALVPPTPTNTTSRPRANTTEVIDVKGKKHEKSPPRSQTTTTASLSATDKQNFKLKLEGVLRSPRSTNVELRPPQTNATQKTPRFERK